MSTPVPSDDALSALREQIDALDLELLGVLNRRAVLVQQVGETKQKQQASVFRPEREAQVLEQVARNNPGPLPRAALENIYREVISACRALERALSVAYLGPAGTFSEQALLRQFGHSVDTVPCASIAEIFRNVENGVCDYGVVPVENSTEGVVSQTLDLLLQTPLSITAEVALRIEHHLWSCGSPEVALERVCAHPQALAQCARWLALHHPQLERVAVSSNGEAARMAAGDAHAAAIAGDLAGQHYGLVAVARHIQDEAQNTTRFAILGKSDAQPSGHDHTSLILSVANQPGAVYEMLGPFKRHGVSMTRFESRPARTGVWTYYFYIDIEGHRNDPPLAAALLELQEHAGFCKILGSYPVA